jgi:hypothetical protein
VSRLGIPEHVIDAVAAHEQQELALRERLYRGGRPPLDVRNRTVILVDDGLATGATMHAAIAALRQLHPARVVAVPTASPETCEEMRAEADDVICAVTPEPFQAARDRNVNCGGIQWLTLQNGPLQSSWSRRCDPDARQLFRDFSAGRACEVDGRQGADR